jgi:cytochrome c
MDSFELNKIIGAILGTLLFVMGAGFLAEAIYEPIEGRGPGYELPDPEEGHGGPVVEEPVIDLGTLLAAANAEQGKGTASSRCGSCHNFDEGAGNKQGPALWGVVGRPIASHAGFTYSGALSEHAADAWTYENLNAFIHAPQDFASGTKMTFAGLKNDQERANVIAYLSTLSASPLPFPPPAPAEPTTAEAAAADGAPIESHGDAVETPTETQSETPVEGTSTGGATEPAAGTEAPATIAPAN